jgi:signal recognition particle receptor subunit beta
MEYKIIFGGQVGAGKTSAIAALSDIPVATTEAKATDEVALLKDTTTVAMDYGLINLPDGEKVHLYGTPGQERFSFMWEVLTMGGLGLVLLLDNSQPDPIKELEFYIKSFSGFIKNNPVVIGITHMDKSPEPKLADHIAKLKELGVNAPVYEVDARNKDDIYTVIMTLLSVLELGLES